MRPDDLIRIDDAAHILRRTVRCVRSWASRGFASNGMKLPTYRDSVTKIRYFSKRDVERIANALFRPVAA